MDRHHLSLDDGLATVRRIIEEMDSEDEWNFEPEPEPITELVPEP